MHLTSPDRLEDKFLNDKYNRLIFQKGRGRVLCLVGGYIRDALRGVSSSDRDFIVDGRLGSFVEDVRNVIGGTLVPFRREEMLRLALPGGITLDFTRPQGTLRQDLERRDFTINSLAWSPERGIVDYCDGLEDLKSGIIRTVSVKNILSDPLRMFRAYRFGAELNGRIATETRAIIRELHADLTKAAPERITSELFNLLNQQETATYLNMALEDRLLTSILPLSYKMLERNLNAIVNLETATLRNHAVTAQVALDASFSQNLSYKGLLTLATLLRNASPSTWEMKYVKFGNRILRHLSLLHRGIEKMPHDTPISRNALFDVFLASQEAATDLFIIEDRADLFPEYDDFKNIWSNSPLTSEDIIRVTGLQTGPKIGQIIEDLRRAQFEGRITSATQAAEYVLHLVSGQ